MTSVEEGKAGQGHVGGHRFLEFLLAYFASTQIGHFVVSINLEALIKFNVLSLLIEAAFTCPNLPCHTSRDLTM